MKDNSMNLNRNTVKLCTQVKSGCRKAGVRGGMKVIEVRPCCVLNIWTFQQSKITWQLWHCNAENRVRVELTIDCTKQIWKNNIFCSRKIENIETRWNSTE